jgi:hypothetical protein
MTENLALDYARRIARGFYDADDSAPFGYRHEDGEEADTLKDVLKAAGVKKKDRDDYDADNLPEGWEIRSAYDYLDDALDFRYIVDSDRSFRDAEICIALGGPNVWISTEDATVTVYWGDKSTQAIPYAVRDALREAMEELWEMGS